MAWFLSRVSDDVCHGKRIYIVRYNSPKSTSEVILIKPNGTYEIQCRDNCFENMIRFYASHKVAQNSGISWLDLSRNFVGELSVNAFDEFV